MVAERAGLNAIAPADVMREIAEAIPADCRESVIVVGSLAVGYHYLSGKRSMLVRTKDADCMLSPHLTAVEEGRSILERLLEAGWVPRETPGFECPGTEETPIESLPAVRLWPPDGRTWFLELLSAPDASQGSGRVRRRVATRHGHFCVSSYRYLLLTEYEPIATELGVKVARPEMMALANLLAHPSIGPEIMLSSFDGLPDIKRSNKDLGRVVAIARLATAEDEDALLAWPSLWTNALQACFPSEWRGLAHAIGSGIRELLESRNDLEQALLTCTRGLLASAPPTLEGFRVTCERLLSDAVEPLERVAK